MKVHAQRSIHEKYNRRLEKAQLALEQLNDQVEFTLNNLKGRHAMDLEKLKASQEVEIEEFLAGFKAEHGVRPWNHASTQLQTLRRQRLLLLAQRRYDDIRRNEQELADLEQHERNEQYRHMAMRRESRLQLMKDRHANELKTLEVANTDRENAFVAAAKVDIENAKRRVAALEQLVASVDDKDRVWALHHRHTKKPVFVESTGAKFRASVLSQKLRPDVQLPPLDDISPNSEHGPRIRAQTPLNRVPPSPT
jgi:hypothetical protein